MRPLVPTGNGYLLIHQDDGDVLRSQKERESHRESRVHVGVIRWNP